jgi:hypothetical protein
VVPRQPEAAVGEVLARLRLALSRRFPPADHATAVLLVVAGVILRVWQYFANTSLWIDEAALARNIIERDVRSLLGPLDYAQVAPPGFLLVERAVVAVAGTSEYALRAFPLVAGIAGLFLFRAVARRLFSGWTVTFAVGLFALGIPFIYFSSQVKQYSSDVMASLLLVLLALEIRQRRLSFRDAWMFGAAGAAIVWMSHPALFVLFGLGAAIALLAITERDLPTWSPLLVMLSLWALSAMAVALHALSTVTPDDAEYFRWFWGDGFMPVPPRTVSELTWLPRRLVWVFGAFASGLGWTDGGLHYRWSPIFAGVMLWGFVVLWRQRRDAALILLFPVITVVCLSAASVYPLTARLLTFLVPCLLLATAAGAGALATAPKGRFVVPALLAILGGSPLYATATALPPVWLQHLRPVLEHVRDRYTPGDRVYVFYGAVPAFGYYAPRLGLEGANVVLGRCSIADPREYLREIDRLRGARRVWVVVTHAQRDGEVELILSYLDRIGRRLDEIVAPASRGRQIEHASAYLYDISDEHKGSDVSVEDYPITLPTVTGSISRWGCHGVTGGEPRRGQ